MRRRLEVVVPLTSEAIARAAVGALSVETRSAPAGTRVDVRADGSQVVLTIEAEETRSLRAATNSYLRLLHAAGEVGRVASNAK